MTWWSVDCEVPLSMGFSRQEYWRGLLFPSARNLLNPRTEPAFFTSPALAGRFFTSRATCESESHSVMPDSSGPPWTIQSWKSPSQNTWVGSPFPSLGELPNPGTKPRSPTLQVDSLPELSHQGSHMGSPKINYFWLNIFRLCTYIWMNITTWCLSKNVYILYTS